MGKGKAREAFLALAPKRAAIHAIRLDFIAVLQSETSGEADGAGVVD